jgi:hypothetical protein
MVLIQTPNGTPCDGYVALLCEALEAAGYDFEKPDPAAAWKAFKNAARSTRDEAKEVWVDIGDYVGLDLERSFLVCAIRICTETCDFTSWIVLRTDWRDEARFGYAKKSIESIRHQSYEAFFAAVEASDPFQQAMLRTFVDTDVVCDQIPPPKV